MSEAIFGKTVAFIFLAAIAVVVARNTYGKRHWIAWRIATFSVVFLGLKVAKVEKTAKWLGCTASKTPIYVNCLSPKSLLLSFDANSMRLSQAGQLRSPSNRSKSSE